ncbi:MAG TPA: lamin tail domain-containing protein [Cryomorphaceae bacterium]|nr:lamin tail domain-containing protein [Cryomorphaceae bacterium]
MPFTIAAMLICGPSFLWAQVNDDFSDGNFTENPPWEGSEALWVIESEQLRSNSPGSATYAISTPSAVLSNTQWRFYVNLDFATSGANFVDVYLASDHADLNLAENGYFIRMGGTPDEISLYKLFNGSSELLIDGEDEMIGSSSNNIFDIVVQRDADANWQIWIDKEGDGIVQDGGSVTDDAVLSTVAFGFRITQSGAASAVNSHYFDDISVGAIPVDETPPELLEVEFSSAAELTLYFSEFVDAETAENPSNYSLNGGIGTPQSAELNADNPAQVNLSFDSEMVSGTTYEITVTGVTDLAANPMTAEQLDFLYFETSLAQFKDVIFNEIFADPTPTQGLPDAEFIELYNPTGNYYSLQDYILINTLSERQLPEYILFPCGYVLLCDISDTSLFSAFGDVIGIPSFVALANSGDSLTLKNPDGEDVDGVTYSSDWYGSIETSEGGYSLELVNPFAACSGAENWTASNHPTGGTPCAQNSVFDDTPDTEPPGIIEAVVLAPSIVQLHFSEVMDEQSIISGEYAWSQDIENAKVSVSPDLLTADLVLSGELIPGNLYTLTVSDISDCEGNEILPETTVEIIYGEEPGPGELIVSEIMADPTPALGVPEAEYFELYNNSEKAIELYGCTIENKAFTTGKVLLPGNYLLCIDAALEEEFIGFPEYYSVSDMGVTFFTNGGREVNIFNSSGERIDYVDYDFSWYDDADKSDGGYSLERINLNEPCRGGNNWGASQSPTGGTPGEENSIFSKAPDTNPPVLVDAYVHDSTRVELVFNEVLGEVSAALATVEFSPTMAIAEINLSSPSGNSLELILSSVLETDTIYRISIGDILDCSGNTTTGIQSILVGRSEPAEPGDVLINEVLFNPRTGGADFVEIVNRSEKIISLSGWHLLNRDLSSAVVSEEPIALFPGHYLLLTRDAGNIEREYPFGSPENYLEMETTPAYNNGSGTVILADEFENTIDLFDYLEEYHLSLLNSVKGVSLERLSFTRPTNDPGNWTSAAEQVGFATPGYLNSQFNPEGTAAVNFELQEKIFSPDNDGFQDIMLINYTLDEPGSVASVKIFDRCGREVKNLENGLVLGTTGTISWDGVADNGSKARIGPHVVFIDVFHPNGFKHTQKLPVLVAGKLSD